MAQAQSTQKTYWQWKELQISVGCTVEYGLLNWPITAGIVKFRDSVIGEYYQPLHLFCIDLSALGQYSTDFGPIFAPKQKTESCTNQKVSSVFLISQGQFYITNKPMPSIWLVRRQWNDQLGKNIQETGLFSHHVLNFSRLTRYLEQSYTDQSHTLRHGGTTV